MKHCQFTICMPIKTYEVNNIYTLYILIHYLPFFKVLLIEISKNIGKKSHENDNAFQVAKQSAVVNESIRI